MVKKRFVRCILNISDLFESSTTRSYRKKHVIIYEGDPVSTIFYIKSGYVKVYNILNDGTERIIFIYGPGDVFPLSTYLSGSRAIRYFYVGLSDVKLLTLPSEQLERKIRNDIAVGETLVNYTVLINLQFLERIEILSVNDARRKVVALLAFLVIKIGTKSPISRLSIYLTHQELSEMCGLTRESTSIQLEKLRKEGVLLGKRATDINVTKLEALKSDMSIVI